MDTTRASLLLQIKDRDNSTAWREFDAIYRPLLFRLARARGVEPATAEDIVQQCMANVHHHIAGFEYDPSKGRFKAWLRTMAINLIHNLGRGDANRAHRNRLIGSASADSQAVAHEPSHDLSPEEAFDKLWMEEHLGFCLKRIKDELGESTYEAFRLYVLEDRPVEEVCKKLQLTSAQLYRIKWRVTQRLGEEMKALLGSEEAISHKP